MSSPDHFFQQLIEISKGLVHIAGIYAKHRRLKYICLTKRSYHDLIDAMKKIVGELVDFVDFEVLEAFNVGVVRSNTLSNQVA